MASKRNRRENRGRDTVSNLRKLPLSKYAYTPVDRIRRVAAFVSSPLRQSSLEARKAWDARTRIFRKPRRVTHYLNNKPPQPNLIHNVLSNIQSSVVLGAENAVKRLHPKTMTVCAARAVRREVLHALHIAGRTGLGGPTYTEKSKVRCS